ncbi:hypothetical protein [Candidatus Oleimmundimicrobium sp.]|uniref:DUF6812 domain-containing protein n=1 Tax=Candidatus Oleimmundimicrobium sp. TaxID=3060597 RepID=UPI002718918B|nr:hypothetical protein [Candidatus Oleimmundimicrobium sp.]MDO8885879.1 hypothetical protein [Candidatus Oleimmundimicrobium sp.]
MYTEKQKIRVMMCTSLYRIEGDMYIIPGSRITDMFNVKTHDFFPLTNVKVTHSVEDKVFYEVGYAAIHRDSVLLVFPIEGEEKE